MGRTKIVTHKIIAGIARMMRNRDFILVLAVVLGLAVGQPGATLTQPSVLPLLGLVMTLSAVNITSRELVSLRRMPKVIGSAILLNFVVLGGVILLLARWLTSEEGLWAGFVMLAAVPPAPAIIPFTYTLGGDTLFSLIGVAGTYLAALILTPAAMWLFLGIQSVDPLTLLIILGELILVPIAFSRILFFTGLARRVERWRGTIVDWSLFVIVFTLIGLNRQAFLGDFHILLRMVVIGIAISFALGALLELAGKALRLRRETSISVVLMGTLKNYSLAGGLALTLFPERAAIPASVCLVFGILFVAWLSFHLRWRVKANRSRTGD